MTLAPQAVPVGATEVGLYVERNVGATPLDTLPQTSQVTLRLDYSLDGGATWVISANMRTNGGALSKNGGFTTVGAADEGVLCGFRCGILGDPNSTTRQVRGS